MVRVSAVPPLKGKALPRGTKEAVDQATAGLAASGDLLRSSTPIRNVSVTRNTHIEPISVYGLFAFPAKSSLRGAARAQSSLPEVLGALVSGGSVGGGQAGAAPPVPLLPTDGWHREGRWNR